MGLNAFAGRSVAVAAIALGVGACSGSSGPAIPDPGVTCGAGTSLVNGECTIVDGGVVDAGGSADASTDGATVDGAATDGAASSDGDAMTLLPADDCPTGAITVNCSDTCGATAAPCKDVSCNWTWRGFDPRGVKLYGDATIIRTPNRPVQDPECTTACANNTRTDIVHPVFAVTFGFAATNTTYGVRVGAPWRINIAASDYVEDSCPLAGEEQDFGCVQSGGGGIVTVWTDDPSAPARNITISAYQHDCP